MYVLQEQDCPQRQSNKYKIQFLTQSNLLMSNQYQQLSTIISKYQNIIQSSLNPSNQQKQILQTVYSDLNTYVYSNIHKIQNNIQHKNIVNIQEAQLTSMFMLIIIQWFEEKAKMLRQQNHYIEKKTQQIQNLENQRNYNIIYKQEQQKANTVATIEAYQIFQKIYDRCHKMVIEVKKTKKKLQGVLANIQKREKKQVQMTSSTIQSEHFRKSLSGQGSIYITKNSIQSMNNFQKSILLYKKKKYTNQKLLAKVKYLKNQVLYRKKCIQKIKSSNLNEDTLCRNCQLLQNNEGQIYFSINISSLSIGNQSINKGVQINFDFSKISIPSKVKNIQSYSEYKKKLKKNQNQS